MLLKIKKRPNGIFCLESITPHPITQMVEGQSNEKDKVNAISGFLHFSYWADSRISMSTSNKSDIQNTHQGQKA